jgi:Phytanoyl-CoA dioxygenase (PhyH)
MARTYDNRAAKQVRPHGPLSKVFGDDGFSIDVKLHPDELAELRRLTTKSWLEVIGKVAPDKIDTFEKAGIEDYHRLSHLIDHARIWTTETRTFSSEVVDAIRSFGLFDLFDRECPGYRICSEMPPYGDLGRARVNWRLVRPGDDTDLGPIHADYWFEAVMDGWNPTPAETVKVKIWIPIHLEQGLTGFAYVPGSHRQQLPFSKKRLADGHYKPHLDEADLPVALRTLDTPCGTSVLFNYNLVHRGANSSKAARTRVSMETTLDVPRRRFEERYGDLSAFY